MIRLISSKEWQLIKKIRNKISQLETIGIKKDVDEIYTNKFNIIVDDVIISNVENVDIEMKRDHDIDDGFPVMTLIVKIKTNKETK